VQLDSLGAWRAAGSIGQGCVALDDDCGLAFQQEGERMVDRDLADFHPSVRQQPSVGKFGQATILPHAPEGHLPSYLQASATHLPPSSCPMGLTLGNDRNSSGLTLAVYSVPVLLAGAESLLRGSTVFPNPEVAEPCCACAVTDG
jgi:hypothetical protein